MNHHFVFEFEKLVPKFKDSLQELTMAISTSQVYDKNMNLEENLRNIRAWRANFEESKTLYNKILEFSVILEYELAEVDDSELNLVEEQILQLEDIYFLIEAVTRLKTELANKQFLNIDFEA